MMIQLRRIVCQLVNKNQEKNEKYCFCKVFFFLNSLKYVFINGDTSSLYIKYPFYVQLMKQGLNELFIQ